LALNEENKLDMAHSGIMGDIVSLAKMDDHLTVRQACGALANLSENRDTHTSLVGGYGASYLCRLIDHDDIGLLREVVRCLANLAGNYDTHGQLLDDQVPSYVSRVPMV
jgi:hypothetical protein